MRPNLRFTAVKNQGNRAELVRLIGVRFDEAELRGLTYELNVDYEGLLGQGKAAKVQALVEYMERRNRMDDLMRIIRRERPEVAWPEMYGG